MSGARRNAAASQPPRSSFRQQAERRLHRYFEDVGLEPGGHRDALVRHFLEQADRAPDSELVATALERAEAALGAWFGDVLSEDLVVRQPALLIGRAAYRTSGGEARWPGVLLARDLPAGFVETMRAAVPMATPPEEPGIMVEQRFESWSLRGLAPARLARLVIAGGGRQAVAS